MNTKKVIIISLLCLLAFYSISITIIFVEDKSREKSEEKIITKIMRVNDLITNINAIKG